MTDEPQVEFDWDQVIARLAAMLDRIEDEE
jgi:hypothetical protein